MNFERSIPRLWKHTTEDYLGDGVVLIDPEENF